MNINYELPDDLHRALKIRAAEEGVTLKELIIRTLRSEVGPRREMVAWCEVHGEHATYQADDGKQACYVKDGNCHADDYWLTPIP